MSTFTTRSFLLFFLLGVLVPAFESAPISVAEDKTMQRRISYADDKAVHPRKSDPQPFRRRSSASTEDVLERRNPEPELHIRVPINDNIRPRVKSQRPFPFDAVMMNSHDALSRRSLYAQVPLNADIEPREENVRRSLYAQVPLNADIQPRSRLFRRSLYAQVPLNADIQPRTSNVDRRNPTAEPAPHRYGHKALDAEEGETPRPPSRIMRSHRRPHSKFNDFTTSRGGRNRHVVPFTRMRVNWSHHWKHVNPFQSVSHTFTIPEFAARRKQAALRAKEARAKFAEIAKAKEAKSAKAAHAESSDAAAEPVSRPVAPAVGDKNSSPLPASASDPGASLQPRVHAHPSLWSRALKAASDVFGSWGMKTYAVHSVETNINGKKSKKEEEILGVAGGPVSPHGAAPKVVPAHLYQASSPGTSATLLLSDDLDAKLKSRDLGSPSTDPEAEPAAALAASAKPHAKSSKAESALSEAVPPTSPASPSGAGAGELGGGSLKKTAVKRKGKKSAVASLPDAKPQKAKKRAKSKGQKPGSDKASALATSKHHTPAKAKKLADDEPAYDNPKRRSVMDPDELDSRDFDGDTSPELVERQMRPSRELDARWIDDDDEGVS